VLAGISAIVVGGGEISIESVGFSVVSNSATEVPLLFIGGTAIDVGRNKIRLEPNDFVIVCDGLVVVPLSL
jgi:hypothetical protein